MEKKLVFFHTGEKIKEDVKGNLYTDGSYNEKVWSRYQAICEQFVVICRKEYDIYTRDFAKKKFNIFDTSSKSFFAMYDITQSIGSFFNFKKRRENRKNIKDILQDADLVIIRLPCAGSSTVIHYAKKFKKPYLIELVGCPWDMFWNHSLKGKILAPVCYLQTKRAVLYAPYIVYVTREFLQKRYPTKGEKISCSDVCIPDIDKEVLLQRINKINKNKSNKVILGTLGAINLEYKGHQYVIRAIARLNALGYNFEYQLVGGGDEERLKRLSIELGVEKEIKFIGSLQHERVFEWLDDIDIYIQPSLTEGLPRSVVEAMSRGCMLIGSNVGGIPELVSEEFLFKKKNVKEIVLILEKITKDLLIKEANRSFENLIEYQESFLNEKRNIFYKKFSNKVGSCND